ncbi:HAMP domain-containing histidine kinase [Paenibacillus doosanensis]|uniref:histidine kinase n=1 Tax=Paenibacillus konkukensis TaxID=2020716 RepID=A0ABY4RG21_9BACL|nr:MULTISPECIES: HAMP domain-containing sensor histidine kinase [Paenibacillus]MCS7462273.1 HAMP domain-containing histidine kinase [Paenibacillus doosanensis]UQZ80921.1 putative sensor histidine kinase TcrY [Paenibacillus konkukensis]
MFDKLRNRLLLMNMVIISIIMLGAFTIIYTITYQNVRKDIMMDLQHTADASNKKDGPIGKKGGPAGPRGGDMPGEDHMRSVSFSLQTDKQWSITETNSRFDMSSDFYAAAVKKAAEHPEKISQFTLNGTRWAYSVINNQSGYFIVYMDVTDRQTILTNLVYTFSAVALFMLGIIYLTSRYFADRSIEPVKEAFEKQKRFIADASHELRTPLAVINTNADVLLANGEDTVNGQAKWLHHIKAETERMKTLTRDLLYLTEMDDAKPRMLYVPFDLSEAVESVILTMEAVIFEKDLALDYDIEPELTVTGSSEQMKQVAMILLDNAIKYSNPKGSIVLALKKHQNHVRLTVSNTGPGIPAEHLDKIFDRFYRADPSRSRQNGGYGLGLAIAKSIVVQHQGKISAKSVPNGTTTFEVQLNER